MNIIRERFERKKSGLKTGVVSNLSPEVPQYHPPGRGDTGTALEN